MNFDVRLNVNKFNHIFVMLYLKFILLLLCIKFVVSMVICFHLVIGG